MANQLYGNVWYVDTVGLISLAGIKLKAVTFYPAAVDDAALFTWFRRDVKEATSGTIFGTATTGTITNQYTLTMSGGTYLPSSIAVGDFFALTHTSGDAANVYDKATRRPYTLLVKTAGNNTVVEVVGLTSTPWTNEATKKYTWEVYTGLKAMAFHAEKVADMEHSMHITFPGGHHFENLALASISSSAYCLLYLA